MSDGLNLNFGGVKASTGFAIITSGTYDMRIEELEVRDTKPKEGIDQKASDGSKASYLNVQYKVTEEGSEKGKNCFGINSMRFPADPLNDTAKERQTREIFLSWLNTVTGTDWDDTDADLNLKNLIGSPVRVSVIESSYDGNPKNEVKRVMAPGSGKDNLDAVRRTL